MSIGQIRAIFPASDELYAKFCKKHGLVPKTETLEDGTTAHWIGSSSAEKVLVYFHGGGYASPLQNMHIGLLWHFHQLLSAADKDVGILILAYGLVPTARYPRQLQQAISLLDHVIYNLKKSPSNIILYGDAAGGNLATAVLSHLSHPHPSTTTPITPLTLPSKLRGVVLSSPWLSFSCTAPSFTHNANLDLRSPTTSLKWSAAFLGTSNTENYNQAATAPTEWWSDVQVEDVLIVAGGDEICVDDIRFFAGKLRSVKREVEFVVGEREAHGGPDLDLEMRFKDVGVQGVKVDSWLLEKF